ncbi:MAG: undecaprenyl diphosphate synthase family protein, partial [Methanopyraceae archaeon]
MRQVVRASLKPVYKMYERVLERKVRRGKIPEHVGIIMDGNRRFARELGLKPWEGHRYGANKLEEVLEWCYDLG